MNGLRRLRHRALAAVLLAGAAGACGGAGSPSIGSLLDLGEGGHEICVPAPEDPADGTIFGDVLLRPHGGMPVTIREISLVGAQDMELREAVLVHVEQHEGLVGMRHTSNLASMPAGWDARFPAEGATVDPGDHLNLVVIVDIDADDTASAEAARVVYELQDGRRYQQDTPSSMLVTRRSCRDVLQERAG